MKSNQQQPIATRLLHTMLRVGNLERSIQFYTEKLGMRMCRKEEYPGGQFTLAFVGFGDEHDTTVLELTENWDCTAYEHGSAFGHIALGVVDMKSACQRLAAAGVNVVRAPGPMTFDSPNRRDRETIAFIEDPDGYRIELVETDQSSMPRRITP